MGYSFMVSRLFCDFSNQILFATPLIATWHTCSDRILKVINHLKHITLNEIGIEHRRHLHIQFHQAVKEVMRLDMQLGSVMTWGSLGGMWAITSFVFALQLVHGLLLVC